MKVKGDPDPSLLLNEYEQRIYGVLSNVYVGSDCRPELFKIIYSYNIDSNLVIFSFSYKIIIPNKNKTYMVDIYEYSYDIVSKRLDKDVMVDLSKIYDKLGRVKNANTRTIRVWGNKRLQK